MRPLQSIAMGLVIVALQAPFAGYDALPDPVGWLLVLLGIRGLPPDLWQRGSVVALAVIATLLAIPLWIPSVVEALDETHDSLLWATNLPQLAFAALLARGLALLARSADDGPAARWLGLCAVGFVAAAALPVLVFGAGLTSLEVATYVGAGAVLLLLIALLFTYSGRQWTGFADPAPQAPESS